MPLNKPPSDFVREYRRALSEIFEYWTPEMQRQMAVHCQGWAPGNFDFKAYLEASAARFGRVYSALTAHGSPGCSVCDIGGFWGVLPTVLHRLGFKVAMTEALAYYDECFTPLFDFVRRQGVEIIDYDPFGAAPFPAAATFDWVTVLAVIEHYPHSLKDFMRNVSSIAADGGRYYFEVPNIAFWPKRLGLLRGHTPLPPLSQIYLSEVPFIGHHHEFTMAELQELMTLAGLSATETLTYNYSPGAVLTLQGWLTRPLASFMYAAFPTTRECLAVIAQRSSAGKGAESNVAAS
jgi:2-polyprenyl-3-methyl-5-hydroxy-6-metoxy-1,4-benzoquinol methylase